MEARARLRKGALTAILGRMNEQSFEDAVERIVSVHPEYSPEAYAFLRDGLDWASEKLGRNQAKDHHLTGRELCEGLRDYALLQYGPLALLVLMQWGVFETSDFGKMVYWLIDEGVFGKKPEDRLSDFDDVYSFEEVFDRDVPEPDFLLQLFAKKKPARKKTATRKKKPAGNGRKTT